MRRPSVPRLSATRLAPAMGLLMLAGCSTWFSGDEPALGVFSPYRIDIQQGNVITRDQLALVKPGMNRLQVRDILGAPLLADPFHASRWDYIFTLRQPGKPLVQRDVVLIFDGDSLKTIDAPELPTEREFIASIARSSGTFKASILELTPEQVKSLPVPPKPPAAPAEPTGSGPVRNYPPLDPS